MKRRGKLRRLKVRRWRGRRTRRWSRGWGGVCGGVEGGVRVFHRPRQSLLSRLLTIILGSGTIQDQISRLSKNGILEQISIFALVQHFFTSWYLTLPEEKISSVIKLFISAWPNVPLEERHAGCAKKFPSFRSTLAGALTTSINVDGDIDHFPR